METTTIEVREDQAEDLHDLKERGDSYKDVIDRLLAGNAVAPDPDTSPEPEDGPEAEDESGSRLGGLFGRG